jgi:thiol-disulfide isomerase/thioredoxin
MPKPLRIITIVLATIIVGGLGYVLMSGSATQPTEQATTSQPAKSADTSTPSKTSSPTSTTQTSAAGTYADYSAESVAGAKGARVLFFHAPWCPQCRQLDTSIKEGKIPLDVTIYKVDYDKNQALRQKYGVTIQTTLVLLDEQGNEVKKYVAYDQPSLTAVIENLL